MKIYTWQVTVEDDNNAELHTVSYTFSRLKGKITVTINDDGFDLPAGFLGFGAKRREIFRLGDEQAVLVVDKHGKPTLLFRNQVVTTLGEMEADA